MGALIRATAVTLLLAGAAAAPELRPTFLAQPGRIVAVTLPAKLLAEKDVDRQLRSGLTTTFVIAGQQRDSDRRGAARIEIRFDLWDEVWLVRRIEFDGKEDKQRLASREALEKWWASPLRIFAAAADRAALSVVLTVLPFSAAEGEDARQWISKSGGVSQPEGGSPLVAALIGTTLSAKPIRTFRWQTEVVFR